MAVDWKVADSLLQLRDQLDRLAPLRSKKSDGFKGDANHQSRASDHNPWWLYGFDYYVTAGDFTHDPDNGLDCHNLWSALQVARDRRLKYIIWDGWIVNSRWVQRGGNNIRPWTILDYQGSNPHTKHLHVSVLPDRISLLDTPWLLPGLTEDEDLPSAQDVWDYPVYDYYTKDPEDAMPAAIGLAHGIRHAAEASVKAGEALNTALRVEGKLDELLAKLAAS